MKNNRKKRKKKNIFLLDLGVQEFNKKIKEKETILQWHQITFKRQHKVMNKTKIRITRFQKMPLSSFV